MLAENTVLYRPEYHQGKLTGLEKFTVRHRQGFPGIFDSDHNLFARFFTGTGFVTPSVKLSSGKWTLQSKVSWEPGPPVPTSLAPEGWLQLKTQPLETHIVLQQACLMAQDFVDRAVEHGKVFIMTFPDTTVGYRVEVPTFTPDGAQEYAFLLTAEEFLQVFGEVELARCLKGLHQTFFY